MANGQIQSKPNGLNSFLENFLGRDKSAVKLALYRLWLGRSTERMQCLTKAQGDGIWGQLHGAYFLAEGERTALGQVFESLSSKYGSPVYGGSGKTLEPIPAENIPAGVIAALKDLPRARKVQN